MENIKTTLESLKVAKEKNSYRIFYGGGRSGSEKLKAKQPM